MDYIIVFGFWLLLTSVLSFFFFTFIITLYSGTFIIYYYNKYKIKNVKIEGNIKFNFFIHISDIIFLLIGPIILYEKEYLIGIICFYGINMILFFIIRYLVKKQISDIREIICFLIIPAIITLNKNKINAFLRPYSNKIIKRLLIISLIIIIITIIISSVIK
jgi:hypothetical protein